MAIGMTDQEAEIVSAAFSKKHPRLVMFVGLWALGAQVAKFAMYGSLLVLIWKMIGAYSP